VSFFHRRKWGITLLAVWLILTGVLFLLQQGSYGGIPYSGLISAVLAIAAGVLILLDR
jgi:drug/metabolite transporter (DMT)-like permease